MCSYRNVKKGGLVIMSNNLKPLSTEKAREIGAKRRKKISCSKT